MKKGTSLILAAAAAATTLGTLALAQDAAKPARYTLPQARQTVNMLNDLYVTSVVETHGTYVKDAGTVPAATVARHVFVAMGKKGWPKTRWLSTTGRPFNPEHNPKDQFEKDAVQALKSGKPRFERVENGNLRVATLVPLVDKSCQMCHTKDKVGDPIGGLAYTVPLVNGK